MAVGRITFAGSPWPEGHAVKAFEWTAELRDGDVWFHFHLQSEDYAAVRHIATDDSLDPTSDWLAAGVWQNYGGCTISSTAWHFGGFRVCALDAYTPSMLDGLHLHVDPLPCDLDDPDALAFHAYLLGHDSVVDHRIAFARVEGSDAFVISWQGRIALTYVGDVEPRHAFDVVLAPLAMPAIDPDGAT